jgi:exosortase/archaeosortase family protein
MFIWQKLTGPVVVLLVEVAYLTTLVEFRDSRMAWIANPLLFSGGLIAATVFFLTTRESLELIRPTRSRLVVAMFFACLHATLCLLFFQYTLELHASQTEPSSTWVQPFLWGTMAVAVAASIVLTTFSFRFIVEWLWSCRRQALVAAGMGIVTIILVPVIRQVWPLTAGPSIHMARTLLDWFPGEAVSRSSGDGLPIIGTSRLTLLVTPECSEMDSLLFFWLLGAVLLAQRWKNLHKSRFLFVIVVGSGVLYFLNAVRIYSLILIGIKYSPGVCVSLAHSRIGALMLLGVSLIMLWFGLWCSIAPIRQIAIRSDAVTPI